MIIIKKIFFPIKNTRNKKQNNNFSSKDFSNYNAPFEALPSVFQPLQQPQQYQSYETHSQNNYGAYSHQSYPHQMDQVTSHYQSSYFEQQQQQQSQQHYQSQLLPPTTMLSHQQTTNFNPNYGQSNNNNFESWTITSNKASYIVSISSFHFCGKIDIIELKFVGKFIIILKRETSICTKNLKN